MQGLIFYSTSDESLEDFEYRIPPYDLHYERPILATMWGKEHGETTVETDAR